MSFFYLIWKNLGRKKIRSVLTILSILVAFILYGLLETLNQSFKLGAELTGADRLVTTHKVSLILNLPYSYVKKAGQVEGVKLASHGTWFGGYYQEEQNQFGQFPVVPEEYFQMYSELKLPDEQMQEWLKNRIGAVIGSSLAERFGWKIGDRIPIFSTIHPQKDGNRTWEFEIEGIFEGEEEQTDTSYLLFHYDYFDEARRWGQGSVGWLMLLIENPQSAAQVAKSIDVLFENSAAETKTSTEKAFVEAFAKQFGDIGTIITLILGSVFFTMLLVAGNTMAQSVRERIPELAVMKTIGFSNQSVLMMVLAESILIVVIAGGIGMAIDYFIILKLKAKVSAYLPGFAMTPAIIVKGVIIMFVMGLVAGLIPAIQSMRLSIVNALVRR